MCPSSGTLVEGLFESDVDETGNIMMYNQLVGAVRFRQVASQPRLAWPPSLHAPMASSLHAGAREQYLVQHLAQNPTARRDRISKVPAILRVPGT